MKLTSAQGRLLSAAVHQHETTGVPLDINDHEHGAEHATALIRAGLAQWHPPIQPIAHVVAKRGDVTIDRHQIVPTPNGRQHVNG